MWTTRFPFPEGNNSSEYNPLLYPLSFLFFSTNSLDDFIPY
jgi:hypothetical protein